MKTPCKVYYPRPGKGQPPKVLTANTPEELKALLRIGWKEVPLCQKS